MKYSIYFCQIFISFLSFSAYSQGIDMNILDKYRNNNFLNVPSSLEVNKSPSASPSMFLLISKVYSGESNRVLNPYGMNKSDLQLNFSTKWNYRSPAILSLGNNSMSMDDSGGKFSFIYSVLIGATVGALSKAVYNEINGIPVFRQVGAFALAGVFLGGAIHLLVIHI